MLRITKFGLAGLFFLFGATALPAELSIEQLKLEAGLEEGAVAVRDIPGWHKPRKILVRGDDELVAQIQAAAPDALLVAVASSAEALDEARDADAIIGFCDEQILAVADDLTWVQIFSSGAERCLAVERVGDGSVLLTNMQKMSSPVIAEHAIAMMLSLTRGLIPLAKLMPNGQWNRAMSRSLTMTPISGKTMLVVGLGGIGKEVARRAAALGMRVVGTRNSSREGPEYVAYVGLSDELYKLASEADVIVNALPITPATTEIFNKEFFAAAKQGAFFINVARGLSVVTDDLVAALESGRIAGAGLDVTEPEPLPSSHPLWQMNNVIITPHVASSGGGRERHRVLIKENLRRYVAGDALLNVVDPARGY